MKEMLSLVNRNMKKYFRDKGALLFSLLSVFIVSALYMFFLADMQIDYVKEAVGNIEGIAELINTWIIAGLVCIPAVSVPLIILCFKVDDYVDGTQNDLYVTSAKRLSIMMGYIVSAVIVGFVMSMLCLALGEIFIAAKGGSLLSFVSMMKVVGMILLIVIAFTGFEFFIITFIKSNSGINVANSILNVLLGFLLGLYVPIGMLGGVAADVIKSFPLLQGSSVIRQIMMKDSLDAVFSGAPVEIMNQVRENYGVDIVFNGTTMSNTLIIAILVGFGIIFYIVSLLLVSYRKNK